MGAASFRLGRWLPLAAALWGGDPWAGLPPVHGAFLRHRGTWAGGPRAQGLVLMQEGGVRGVGGSLGSRPLQGSGPKAVCSGGRAGQADHLPGFRGLQCDGDPEWEEGAGLTSGRLRDGLVIRWWQRAARGGGRSNRPGHRDLGSSCPSTGYSSIHIVFNKDFFISPQNQPKGGA